MAFLILVPVSWLVIRFVEWKQVYKPTAGITKTPELVGLRFDDVDFMTEDGHALHGWWLDHPSARGTVLYCHGNGGNLGDRLEVLEYVHRLQMNVFAFDYRGYGRSRGVPTENGTYRDARAAYEVVRAKYGHVNQPPVILYGRSLGASIALQLASDKKVRGVIVEGGFESIRAMAKQRYAALPVHRFCTMQYNTLKKIKKISVPVLVAHSIDDELIPMSHSKNLFDAAPEPKTFVELRGSHDQIGWSTTSGYWEATKRFIDQALG